MGNHRILLVEDNPDDVELTLLAFKAARLGNEITVARDGVEALDALLGPADGSPPDELPTMVLLDLKLPRVNGIEVLRAMRSNPRTAMIPVIVLTTSDEEGDIVSSYHLGANSYVKKPVDFNDFQTAVQQLGMYWLLLNRTPALR
jgi:CheY-like chemotaxis protein